MKLRIIVTDNSWMHIKDNIYINCLKTFDNIANKQKTKCLSYTSST